MAVNPGWLKMNKKFDLTPEELEFLIDLEGGQHGELKVTEKGRLEISKVAANFYLAKQMEASSKSTDKSSKAMIGLTWAIAIAAIFQAVATLVQALK